MGTSFDDRKASRKDQNRLPVPNLPLWHWSSLLFDLRTQSSTDVPVLLLNQPFMWILGLNELKPELAGGDKFSIYKHAMELNWGS